MKTSTFVLQPSIDAANTTRRTSPRWALASLCAAAVLPSLNTSIANAALPTLATAFSASFQAVQWVVLSYLLATTTLIVSAGRLGDMVGRRRLLVAGLMVFTVGSALCGVASSLSLLIFSRAVQGVGAAFMIPLTLALVSETVPKGSMGRALGLLGTMSALGTALGPTLGGVLVHLFDWRAVFLVNLPLGLLAAMVAYRHLPADLPLQQARLDGAGTLLLAFTLGAYALAMTSGSEGFGMQSVALLAVAGLGLGWFFRIESRTPFPLVRLALLREPAHRAGLVLSALVATVMMTTLVVGPFYLSQALGLEVVRVGAVLSVGPLVAAMVGIPAGRLVDRFGSWRVTQWGLSGVAAGSFLLAVLPTRFGVVGYVLPLAIVTAGYALFQTANNAAVLSRVSAAERGMVSGLLNLARNLGLVTGGSAMAAIFALASETDLSAASAPQAVASGTRNTFGVATLLMTIAFLVSRSGRRDEAKSQAGALVSSAGRGRGNVSAIPTAPKATAAEPK